ncbi:MAG: response regulator transcription factor [Actinomycetes bacterium]
MDPDPRLVLVVDDNEMIRHLIAVNLELEGFTVITACDGPQALAAAVHHRPAVITLDVVMPDQDGFRTAEMLRTDPRTAPLRIVMVTACAQEADLRRGVEIGVDAYLTKPFDPEVLVRTVQSLADRAGPISSGG